MKRLLRLSVGDADRRRDIERELAFYVEQRTAELIAAGMDPAEARATAERAFGDYETIARECGEIRRVRDRERRRRSAVEEIWQDVRHGFRSLRRSPGFTTIALLTLALGIGASTAVFTVVNAVLLRPLPYAEPERVVMLHNRWEGTPEAAVSPAEFLDYVQQRGAFNAMGAYTGGTATLLGPDGAERIGFASTTPGVFATLGVAPLHGRLFAADEGQEGRQHVAILSHGFWQRAFGSDLSIIGKSVQLNGASTEVVGVMPRDFRLPADFSTTPVDIYLPYAVSPEAAVNRGSHFLDVVGRLARGTSIEQADAAIAGIARDFVARFPNEYPADMRFGAWLQPAHEQVVGDVRALLRILAVAVAFVLLIACANVASLVLVRSEDRRREIAVRAALGAGRGQIARQLLLENAVLALAGGALGVGVALLATRAFIALQPGDIPRIETLAVDANALLFALGASLLAAMLFGAGPAFLSRTRLETLREGGSRTTSSKRAQRFRHAMVAIEVGLSVVLLAGAGLMIRSFTRLLSTDPGYRTENVLTLGLTTQGPAYSEDVQRRDFHARVLERVRALPGVRAAGAVSNLPLASGTGDLGIQIEGRETRDDEVSNRLDWQVVTPGYFDAIGIDIVRGRGITEDDHERAPGAVVISEAAAKRYFEGMDPIGKRFTLGGQAGPGMVTIVGIARDTRHDALDEISEPHMYLAHRQFTFWHGGRAVPALAHVIHTPGDPNELVPAVRRIVSEIDPRISIGQVRTMQQLTHESVAEPRFVLSLLGFFAAAALGLALVGIYGLIAYTVSRRAAEFGVRAALGARALQILRLVIAQGMRPVAVGALLGVIGALALTRTLSAFLFEIAPRDPGTFVSTVSLLVIAALAACAVPAWRAARIDPARALRGE